jgi:uncharacterized protein (UPF0254 family)
MMRVKNGKAEGLGMGLEEMFGTTAGIGRGAVLVKGTA